VKADLHQKISVDYAYHGAHGNFRTLRKFGHLGIENLSRRIVPEKPQKTVVRQLKVPFVIKGWGYLIGDLVNEYPDIVV
jgi:hypothetical protein